ncbi:fimbrillin family protein, partial [Bacteroides stercorirosoris]|uniref:fimbrillin family protein n=1 Tax=Bacteroides stercorirosoris TaxID=871324 RepID=UPI0011DE20C5
GLLPYAATLNPDGILPLDVSRQQSLPAIDLMSATATADKDHPNVALRFSHRLTRLVFSISGKGSVSTASLVGATLTIRGMDTRADYNLHTDTYTTADAATAAAGNTSSTTAASGDNNTSPQDISVPLNASGTQGTAIVLPRSAAAGAGVSFIITLTDGSHFTAHLSDTHEPESRTRQPLP